MKYYRFALLGIAVFLFFAVNIYSVEAVVGIGQAFNRSLKLGMSGEDVKLLQIILNEDPDTRVADVGPGSKGQETTYFGQKTKQAVIKFQEKYNYRILSPNNLSKGTGYVGPSTISKLNDKKTDYAAEILNTTVDGNSTKTSPTLNTLQRSNSPIAKTQQESTLQNNSVATNQKNIINRDSFINNIEELSRKKGLNQEQIGRIRDLIIRETSTSTDLMATFVNVVQSKSKKTSQINENRFSFGGLFKDIAYSFTRRLRVNQAQAGTGLPFGGPLVYSFYCNCSNSWLLEIGPNPPLPMMMLNYIEGSQAFLSFNIPITSWLLGEYTAGAGVCAVFDGPGCASIPSQGLINPMVGSSAE